MILKDKISVITGAGSGIGADFSRALVAKGGIVYGIARRKANLDRLAAELGERFIPVTADVFLAAIHSVWCSFLWQAGPGPYAEGSVPVLLIPA